MKTDVYDAFAKTADGRQLHFDVLLPSGAPALGAERFARQWLASLGDSATAVEIQHCQFCHTEQLDAHRAAALQANGHLIQPLSR